MGKLKQWHLRGGLCLVRQWAFTTIYVGLVPQFSVSCIVPPGYITRGVYAKHVGRVRSKRRLVPRESVATSREMRVDRYALQADRNKLYAIKLYYRVCFVEINENVVYATDESRENAE